MNIGIILVQRSITNSYFIAILISFYMCGIQRIPCKYDTQNTVAERMHTGTWHDSRSYVYIQIVVEGKTGCGPMPRPRQSA